MESKDNEKKHKNCAQKCEEQLPSCLEGNSEGSCQLKYNRCRINCGNL